MMETNNKLREALMQIYDRVNSLDENCGVDPVEIRDISRAALSEPVKNCEVGTPDEQADRFQKFCLSRTQPWHGCDGTCPLLMSEKCALNWAQMPYEAQKGGAK